MRPRFDLLNVSLLLQLLLSSSVLTEVSLFSEMITYTYHCNTTNNTEIIVRGALLMLLIPNTTANHATNVTYYRSLASEAGNTLNDNMSPSVHGVASRRSANRISVFHVTPHLLDYEGKRKRAAMLAHNASMAI